MESIQPDPLTRKYLLDVLSLCLTTETFYQHFWIFTGAGANGKSKLMNLLKAALGDYFGSAPATLLTRRREDANNANDALKVLEKARIAVFSEGAHNESLKVSTIKLFTGEDKLSSRGMWEKQRWWTPVFKCILICNDIPKLEENTWAAWRRIKVVHFPMIFVDNPRRLHEGQKDSKLGEKLNRCVGAFICILFEHFRQLKAADTLAEAPAVTAATEQYKSENDIFAEFQEECLVEEKDARLEWKKGALPAFRRWARENRKNIPDNSKEIKKLFVESLGPILNRSFKGASLYGWKDCKLLDYAKESRGERLVRVHLEHRKISFATQHTFPGCQYKKLLPFDFFIKHGGRRGCIEFQGRQHYEPVSHFGGQAAFNEQVLRDGIKKQFCAQAGIPLLAIPYTDIDRVQDIVDAFLTELGAWPSAGAS